MSAVQTIPVAADDGEIRLDRWFRRHYPTLGHGRLEKLLRTGQVRVDGKRAKAGDRIAPGQLIRVPPLGDLAPPPRDAAQAPRPRDIAMLERAVLHIDDEVIVLDKPPGLAVQGGTNTERHLDAMLDALRFGAAERPRLVHRLDRDTSGVLVLARSAAAAAALARSFRDKATVKIYWAAVVGQPKPRRGRIDQPLAKLPGPAGERVTPDEEEGKRAVTYYRTVSHAGDQLAWLSLQPITGRTHQLRAHCVALETPILGDGKYGGGAAHPAGVPNARKLHLHARALSLPHPRGGRLQVTAPLPPHMKATWEFFGFDESEESNPFAELAPQR
ncbi:MAG TPA: RluA family pseudouridine synthase [Stellaceae bacterium]|nr:RluA family pseudouridine synthase [Stellaceae bacterium]